MKLLFALLLLLGLGNCKSDYSEIISQPTDPQQQYLLKQVLSTTQENHFQAKPIDDSFSKAMFEAYLNLLDPEKVLFTQKDIQALSQFQTNIDDQLQQDEFGFFYLANHLLNQSIQKAENFHQDIFDKKIDFSSDTTFETNPDKIGFSKNDRALKKRWEQKIKASILEELLANNKDSSDSTFKTNRKEAIAKEKRLIALEFKQYKKNTLNKRFHQYLNTFLNLQDMQTEFLSVEKRAKWNANYTRSLVGIGARIIIEKGYPKIEGLTTSGPAWKGQLLQKDDLILSLKDGNKKAVDLFGMEINEVLDLIKGEAGTSLELTIRRNQNTTLQVPITREAIRFDLVLSLILERQNLNEQVGYIRIPRFYIGDEGVAYHVYQAIQNLKKNQVKGIIIDLRNNQGGSSGETRDILDYFLKEGVVMQTKSKDGDINIQEVNDQDVTYDGDLVVLVNERSASGSELLSGTLQDYGRAIIVGGNATRGKGTMQRFYTFENKETGAEIGSSKMTIATFYSASGRSPQFTGIIPDIILPNNFTYVESGERIHKTALPPQQLEIKPCTQSVNNISNLQTIIAKSKERTKDNPKFQLADRKAQHIKSIQDQSEVSLNFETRKAQQKSRLQLEADFKNIFSNIDGFNVQLLPQDIATADSALIENNKIWQNNIQQDPYVYECFQIISDLKES